MGISAQQHRVATGMFSRYVIISKSNRGKRENLLSCLLSRHMLCALLGIFYFYVILYIFSLTIDANILPGAPLQPKIHSIPCLRSSINHYFMVIFCTIFLRHFKLVYRRERGIGTALTAIFNKLLSTTKTDWKLALVVPVHKKGDKSSVENYRPISLTSLVMKVFERCIKTALYAACSDLLDNRQHGFVNERSCTTQMIPFTDNLALALNNRSRIDVIYFDFAKAFDMTLF